MERKYKETHLFELLEEQIERLNIILRRYPEDISSVSEKNRQFYQDAKQESDMICGNYLELIKGKKLDFLRV